ncbi:MAG: DUF2163 domain-containing protein, partial [Lentisphaerae bacterium]|nr:DUF2163 domain-containing protein [Lentisphaerota bacterium]
MKTVSAELKSHLASETPTVAKLWRIDRKDSTIMGFTEHDIDILYDGVTYQGSTGFTPSAISTSSSLSVDNLEVHAYLDSENITEADILSGLFDLAEINIYLVNYNDTSMGAVHLTRGTLGNISIGDITFIAEMMSLSQQLQQNIGRLHGPDCDADLGDDRCKVNLTSYTVTGTITAVTDNQIFIDTGRAEADDYFNYGKLTWTSGNNDGRSMEVKSSGSGTFILFQPMPSVVQ